MYHLVCNAGQLQGFYQMWPLSMIDFENIELYKILINSMMFYKNVFFVVKDTKSVFTLVMLQLLSHGLHQSWPNFTKHMSILDFSWVV